MGQASSFVLHVVEDAIQRYLKEQKELRKESIPLEEGYGEERGRFHSACSFQQSSLGSFLTVEELRVILTFLPECLSSIDLHHLALLFVLDSDHDGLFSVSDLKQFVVWALAAIPVETPLDDLADVLRGRAVLRCWYLCHMELQKSHAYINRIPVLNGNEGSDDHDSLEYFGCWVLKLLYSVDANKTSYASFNPPPLPDAPNEDESVVMLHSGLCGVSDGKATIARVVSSRNGRRAAGGKYSGRSSYRDAYEKPSQLLPELNINTIPLTSPRERPRIYWNKEGKQGGGGGKESIEGNLHSCVFGAKALKELYRDLSVEKLYGLSFLGLCQMLGAQDKVDIDIGDDGDASPVEREEATAIRKMNVGASFNQSLYVSNTQVEPLTSCCISGVVLNTLIPLAQLPAELQRLARCAVDAHLNAYCPYSNFAVGAALLHNDFTITTGCNYENCTLKGCCAEVCAIVKGNSEGHRTAEAVAVYGRNMASNAVTSLSPETLTPPCGFCRQSLVEVADLSNNYENFLVVLVSHDKERAKVVKLCDLIPLKFGPLNIGMDVSQLSRSGVERNKEKKNE